MIHDSMLYDVIQGRGLRGLKVVKMAKFKAMLICMLSKDLTVNYDATRQYLK